MTEKQELAIDQRLGMRRASIAAMVLFSACSTQGGAYEDDDLPYDLEEDAAPQPVDSLEESSDVDQDEVDLEWETNGEPVLADSTGGAIQKGNILSNRVRYPGEIGFCFTTYANASPAKRARLQHLLQRTWESYANVKFVFRPYCDAQFPYDTKEVQIYYDSSVTRAGTLITDPQVVRLPTTGPLGWQENNIVHEFGHVLGLAHEHWRSEYAADTSKCQAATDDPINYQHSPVLTYDKESVMHYCSGLPTSLSNGDRRTIQTLYGLSTRNTLRQSRQTGVNQGFPASQTVLTTGGAEGVATANSANGSLALFHINRDGDIFRTHQATPGGAWGNPVLLDSGFARAIAASTNNDGTLEVFYVGGDQQVYHEKETSPGGTWTNPTRLLSVTRNAHSIAAARNQNGTLQVFFTDDDYKVLTVRQLSPSGSSWSNIFDTTMGPALDLAVTINGSGLLEVFSVGSDGNLWHATQTSPGHVLLAAATSMGSDVVQVAVPTYREGRMELFYIGHNRQVYRRWQTSPGGSWSSAVALNYDTAYALAVGANVDDRLELFTIR